MQLNTLSNSLVEIPQALIETHAQIDVGECGVVGPVQDVLPEPRERLSRRPQLTVVEIRVVEPQHPRLLPEAAFGLGGRGEPSKVRGASSDLVDLVFASAIAVAVAVAEADFLVVREDIGAQYGFSGGVGRGARGQKAELAFLFKVEGAAVEGESPESLGLEDSDSEVNERHKSFRVTKRE